MIYVNSSPDELPVGYAYYDVADSLIYVNNYIYGDTDEFERFTIVYPNTLSPYHYESGLIKPNLVICGKYSDIRAQFTEDLEYLPTYAYGYEYLINDLYYGFTVVADQPTWAIYYRNTRTQAYAGAQYIRLDVLEQYRADLPPRPAGITFEPQGLFGLLYNMGGMVAGASSGVFDILNYKVFGIWSLFSIITFGFLTYMGFVITKWVVNFIT